MSYYYIINIFLKKNFSNKISYIQKLICYIFKQNFFNIMNYLNWFRELKFFLILQIIWFRELKFFNFNFMNWKFFLISWIIWKYVNMLHILSKIFSISWIFWNYADSLHIQNKIFRFHKYFEIMLTHYIFK